MLSQMLRELRPEEFPLAAAALLELRPHLGDVATAAARASAQHAAGYRLLAAFAEPEPDAVAVAGFRESETLAWGRTLYVDDLVCRPAFRRQGHSRRLLARVEALARELDCDGVHLDSGPQAERAPAHALYFAAGMRISAYHFSRDF